MNIALISGTSGLVGMQLLHQLLQHEKYDFVLSVGRRKLTLKHQKLAQIEGDLTKLQQWDWEQKLTSLSLGGEFNNVRDAIVERKAEIHAFSSLGTTIKQAGSKEIFFGIDHDLVINFGKWAKKLGATKFLYVSAAGADPKSSIFYNQTKGKTEEDLKDIGFEYLGLFRPSLLLGNRNEFRLGEQIASVLMKPLVWLNIFKNIQPIYDYQVARAIVTTALDQKQVKIEVITSKQMQILTK